MEGYVMLRNRSLMLSLYEFQDQPAVFFRLADLLLYRYFSRINYYKHTPALTLVRLKIQWIQMVKM